MSSQKIIYEEVLSKLMRYCAYQERSSFEVKTKAKSLGLSAAKIDKALISLSEENFYSDERFAEALINGKFRVKKWGKYKIIEALYSKGIKPDFASKYLDNLDAQTYLEHLEYWIDHKLNRSTGIIDSAKVYRFLLSKGYESDLIVKSLKARKLM